MARSPTVRHEVNKVTFGVTLALLVTASLAASPASFADEPSDLDDLPVCVSDGLFQGDLLSQPSGCCNEFECKRISKTLG